MKVENPLAFNFIMQDELYLLNGDKDSFINKVAIPEPVIETAPDKLNYLGGNKKNFLIVVHYPDLEFMDDKHLIALENTLKRLGFELDDTAIFNKATYNEITHEHLVDLFRPKKILLLGADATPGGLGIFNLNKPRQLNNCAVLLTFSFDEMMDNTENKKVFWEQMKQL
ncbi:MAG TPA: hypothetical protein VGN20_21320 [Mucilaginibacter sp.]|jgi:hypothetical protein